MSDDEELSEPERLQFISMVQGIFRVWENAYYPYGQKCLDERLWNGMVVQFSGYLSRPGVVRVWDIRKQAYSKDFREFVDNSVAREYVTKQHQTMRCSEQIWTEYRTSAFDGDLHRKQTSNV